jgi:hypothetical protein
MTAHESGNAPMITSPFMPADIVVSNLQRWKIRQSLGKLKNSKEIFVSRVVGGAMRSQ